MRNRNEGKVRKRQRESQRVINYEIERRRYGEDEDREVDEGIECKVKREIGIKGEMDNSIR